MGTISSKPYYDKAYDKVIPATLGDTGSVEFGFNYVKGHPAEWFSYMPLYLGRPDDTIDPPSNVDWMVKSFEEKRHAGGQDLPLYIDTGHGAFATPQKILGDVPDVKWLPAEDVVMMAPDGTEQGFDIPAKSKWLMGKIRIKASELAKVKDGEYGLRPSVAFDPENEVLLNLALCQVPAIEEVPALALRSKRVCKSLMDIPLIPKEVKVDPILLETLTGLMTTLGVPAADIAIVTTISNEGATPLIAALQSIAPPAPPATPPTTENLPEPTTLSKDDVTNIVNEAVAKALAEKQKEIDSLKVELETKSKNLDNVIKKAMELPTEFKSRAKKRDTSLDNLPDYEFNKALERRAVENKTTKEIEYRKWLDERSN